jgi:hypothetical protein
MQPKKNSISKKGIIILSISLSLLLLTGEVFRIPIIKNETYAQQNPNPEQMIGQISPLVLVIASNVTSNNPNTEPEPELEKIEEIVEGIGTEVGEISDTMAIQAMSEIASEVDLDPKGPLAQSLIALSAQLTQGTRPIDIINNIVQRGENIVDEIINKATALILAVAQGEDIEKPLDQMGLTSNLIPSSFSPKSYGGALFFTASSIPAKQVTTFVQAQQQQSSSQQQNNVGISQIVNYIAQQVSSANPGTNATLVQQILVQLAKQTAAQTASKEQAIQEIQQISSQITKFPYGTVSQSLAHFAGQLVSASSSGRADTGTNNVIQIAQQIAQEKASGDGNVSQSVVNKAVQTATGANSNNINEHIRQTAQIIAKQTGVPVEKVEAIIIQMALQIAQAQGKDITGQSIFQIANQIIQNPNGVLA